MRNWQVDKGVEKINMKKTKKRKIFFIIMLSAAISFNLTMISAIGFHLITHYVIQSGGAYYETKYVEISISNEYDPMYNQVTFYNGRHFYDEESSTTLNCSFVEKLVRIEIILSLNMKIERKI